MQPTYKEQFDKITTAYLKNELNPLSNCACFIGNMLNGKDRWALARNFDVFEDALSESNSFNKRYYFKGLQCINKESEGLYGVTDILNLERNFLSVWFEGDRTEDSLFAAMESTLEILKRIHIAKGEVIDPIPFTKRQLQTLTP